MKRDEFDAAAPGDLVSIDTPHGTAVAFVPDQLPECVSSLDIEPRQMSATDRTLGQVDGIGSVSNRVDRHRGVLRRQEAIASSRIEGVRASMADIYAKECGVGITESTHPHEATLVANYHEALEKGLDEIESGTEFSIELLCTLHEHLFRGLDPNHAIGELRDTQNFIGRTRSITTATFVPPPPEHVPRLLEQLVEYINSDIPLPPTVKMALAHYQFETIHPFADGNGRLGRILNSLLLKHEGIDTAGELPLSTYLLASRREYFDFLTRVSKQGVWSEWIDFIREGLQAVASGVITGMETGQSVAEEYEERCDTMTTRQIARVATRRPYFTVNDAASRTGAHYNSVNRGVKTLTDAGILDEVTGRERDRLYRANGVVKSILKPLPGRQI